jgi:translation initiation factor IF-3
MEPFVINYADFSQTNLVDADGNFCGVVHISVAKTKAREANLDLVCFNKPNGKNPALCKIIDYGKWKYQQEKTEKKEKQHAKKETKEVKFSPVISEHDIEHKVKKIIEFLDEGDDVLLTMRFKGIHHRLKDEGKRIIGEILEMCKAHGKEYHRKQDNDNISVRMVKLTEKEKAV